MTTFVSGESHPAGCVVGGFGAPRLEKKGRAGLPRVPSRLGAAGPAQ